MPACHLPHWHGHSCVGGEHNSSTLLAVNKIDISKVFTDFSCSHEHLQCRIYPNIEKKYYPLNLLDLCMNGHCLNILLLLSHCVSWVTDLIVSLIVITL